MSVESSQEIRYYNDVRNFCSQNLDMKKVRLALEHFGESEESLYEVATQKLLSEELSKSLDAILDTILGWSQDDQDIAELINGGDDLEDTLNKIATTNKKEVLLSFLSKKL